MARWQPFAVAAALAAPPVALAILVWPTDASAGDGGRRSDGEVEATLGPGESADGAVSGTLSTDYEVVGDGSVLAVRVAGGGGLDATLTLVDPESGDQLDYDDDTNGLDPELRVELDDGESVIAEVRSLGGQPGTFTISVGVDGDGGGVREGPVTTVVVID